MAVALLVFSSCQKEGRETFQDPLTNVVEENDNPRIEARDPVGTISGKPYRPIPIRPRDNAPCGCELCFGICDVRISFGFSILPVPIEGEAVFAVETENGKAYLTLLTPLEHIESEFGIDEDIDMPFETGVITLKTGLYTFYPEASTYVINDSTFTSYGFVEVDIVE